MFKVGDRVMIKGFDKPIFGEIVGWPLDEGGEWAVLTDGGNLHDCCDDELTPSASVYNGIERYIYSDL